VDDRPPRLGLVLTGGGARGAYQAGVLHGIAEILDAANLEGRFEVLSGVSAGAVNAAFLSAQSTFSSAAEKLRDLWRNLCVEQVFRTDTAALARLGARWMVDIGLGGLVGTSHATHLLDASPLRTLLARAIDLYQMRIRIARGELHGLSLSAASYATGASVHFFEGADVIRPWERNQRLGVRTVLQIDHILASTAIPLLFQPVRIGSVYFGDGGIRQVTPLSPAIHLGAERILAIGIRHAATGSSTRIVNETSKMTHVTLADVAGSVLNGILLDALELDAERMTRENDVLALFATFASEIGIHGYPLGLRHVPLVVIQPSQDLGRLAADEFDRFPATLRYLLRGLGTSKEKGWDLLSHLAFEPAYTGRLLDLGHSDARAIAPAIRGLFRT